MAKYRIVETHCGYLIERRHMGFWGDVVFFSSLKDAKLHIDYYKWLEQEKKKQRKGFVTFKHKGKDND
jgi:hypothetical protein